MMMWIIRGTDRATGELREVQVDAPAEQAARAQAESLGIQVADIQPAANTPLPYATPIPASQRRDPSYSIWKDRWILLSAMLGALVLCIAMGAWGEKQPTGNEPAERIGFYVGTFVGAFLVIYLMPMLITLVVYWLSGRTKAVARSVFIPLALLLALGISAGSFLQHRQLTRRAVAAQQVAKQKQLVNEMQSMLQGKAPEQTAADTGTGTAGSPVNPEQSMTLILEAGRGFVADMKREQVRYEQQLAELFPVPLLDPSHFASGQSLAAYRQKPATLRLLLDEHQQNCDQIMQAFPDKIRALPIPKALQDQTLDGVKRGYARNGRIIKSVCDVNRKICDEMDGLADFFSARLGTYQLRDRTFVFESGADAKEYNDRVARLNELFDEEDRLTQQAQEVAKQGMDKMKNAVGQ